MSLKMFDLGILFPRLACIGILLISIPVDEQL